MTKIIAFAGRRQSGKGTSSNIIHGLKMIEREMIQDFSIEKGGLLIKTSDSKGTVAWGEFDVTRQDHEFTQWAEHNLWPFIKVYSFAEELKNIAVRLFDIPYECVWGSNEQKNTVIPHLLWENMPSVITDSEWWNQNSPDGDLSEHQPLKFHEPGPMTAREFLQFFGTEIGRKIYHDVWVNATIKKIKREGPEIAIIADARFPNEMDAILKAGGMVYRLTRVVFPEDTHYSETAVDDYTNYTGYIDNSRGNVSDLIECIKTLYREI